MNIQDWFPLGWTNWISLQSKGVLRVFSNTTQKNCTKYTEKLYKKDLNDLDKHDGVVTHLEPDIL